MQLIRTRLEVVGTVSLASDPSQWPCRSSLQTHTTCHPHGGVNADPLLCTRSPRWQTHPLGPFSGGATRFMRVHRTAAGVGLSTRVRDKGQGVGGRDSEMRDRAGERGLGGGCRTISFVSRAVDEDGAQDQGLRPKGSRRRGAPIQSTQTILTIWNCGQRLASTQTM